MAFQDHFLKEFLFSASMLLGKLGPNKHAADYHHGQKRHNANAEYLMAAMNISTKAVQNITLVFPKWCQVDICFKAPHFVSLEGLVFPQDFSRQDLGSRTLFRLECTSKLSMVSTWLISPTCRVLSRKNKRYKKLTTVCGLHWLESTLPNPDTLVDMDPLLTHILVIYFHLKVHVWNLTILQPHQNLPTNQLKGAAKGFFQKVCQVLFEVGKSSVYKWVG